ncbi:MAG TPA: glutamine synthetase beta-grasp domain-containing protein, partial [Chloroflexota bacterium]
MIDRSSVAVPTVDKAAVDKTIALAKDRGIKIVDFKFIDLPGLWQHFSIPVRDLTPDLFAEGIGFDGSSIRGFQKIQESDMLLFPDAASAFVDPVLKVPTMSIVCYVVDPLTGEHYERDPRYVAKKAERYLLDTGIATTSYWGPELEFYMLNSLRFDQGPNYGFYYIDSDEGIWNSGQGAAYGQEGPNLAFRPRFKEGYFPVPPTDKLQDLRSEILMKLEESGIIIEVQHHEVGTAGQAEIDMRFDTLTKMADQVLKFKYVVKNVCAQNNMVATFMPKPLFQ